MKSLAKLVVLVCALFIPAQAQWKEFVEQFGNVPVDYTSPWVDYSKKIEWFAKARPVLDKYSLMVIQELTCRHFQVVEISHSIKDYESTPVGWGFTAKVSRAGLAMQFTLMPVTPTQFSATQFVDNFEKKWEAKRNELVEAPWLVVNLDKKEVEVTNFRKMFLYEPQPQSCTVSIQPGMSCTMDLGSATVGLVPKP